MQCPQISNATQRNAVNQHVNTEIGSFPMRPSTLVIWPQKEENGSNHNMKSAKTAEECKYLVQHRTMYWSSMSIRREGLSPGTQNWTTTKNICARHCRVPFRQIFSPTQGICHICIDIYTQGEVAAKGHYKRIRNSALLQNSIRANI